MSIIAQVPINLDFMGLSKQYPLTNLPGKRSIDYLYYYCHELVHIKAMYGDGEHPEYGEYFPMCSYQHRELHFHYNRFINYLLQAQVWAIDGRFIRGVKCYGYKFTSMYSGQPLKQIVINNCVLSRNLSERKRQIEKEKKEKLEGHQHLINWYLCRGLEIDKSAATKWIEQYKETKLRELDNENISKADQGIKSNKVIDTCEGWKYFLERIDRKALGYSDFTVDEFAGRFHGVLTFLKKELRDFITFRGQKLVSVDIKNCQPYLCTILLEPSFWSHMDSPGASLIKLEEINPRLYSEFSQSSEFSSITLLLSSEASTNSESSISKFRQLVWEGQFYEFLKDTISERFPRLAQRFDSRDKVKKEVLRILNCKNQDASKRYFAPSRFFTRLFPEVARVLSFIKAVDHKHLARILQRVESTLVLGTICRRLTYEQPELPIFTIHDCIVTTVGNEEYVKAVIVDVMESKIGAAPRVKYEYWFPQ